ncbi:MAG: NADH-quinone oxidoreductase subunit M [Candidatus Eisenbacteria bacterium]|nr:NADH-quinone oxidoreductase subunit M [Candidatus Latescibacterota bacterium]MBD3303003.1 NADH-quinone oxidoreductase subunit M [Candidatus Eisenbacteria bacterium]
MSPLPLLILVLLAGGLFSWLAGDRRPRLCRWIAAASLLAGIGIALSLFRAGPDGAPFLGGWLAETDVDWIPRLGIGFHLAVDGLSLLLVVLTLLLGLLSVAASRNEIAHRVGFFHFNLLWVLAGVVGVFTALDLFLFYFFWELMLVPMYFLIGIWGHENRSYAAMKFFLFTQASGLLMLLSIIGLVWANHAATGVLSFDSVDLIGTAVAPRTGMFLMLGFFIAFAVKIPAVPVHTWLPDAHTQAPTAGSVILAGLLLKTGAYGLIRFAVPLFPEASERFAPVGMVLGVVGILYGAVLAFGQTDLKRLVAYTSVSHMGFVLIGVYAFNELAWQGVVIQMIAHGLSTGGLFLLVGMLYERLHTRDLAAMGGLWKAIPRTGTIGLMLALASLGLPGMANFVAEFLILVGVYRTQPVYAILATAGLVFAAIYSLRIVARVFHGPRAATGAIADLSFRETAILAVVILLLLWVGLYPQPVLDTALHGLGGM